MERKYKTGDRVVYKGLNATVDYETVNTNGDFMVGLTADSDDELTCTAMESECEPFDAELDESEALSNAYLVSKRMQMLGESLTDKHFRDGNH